MSLYSSVLESLYFTVCVCYDVFSIVFTGCF